MTRALLISGLGSLAGFLPLVLLLLTGCAKAPSSGPAQKLGEHGVEITLPSGWTGGRAGGTYEFRSPDGGGRVRVGKLEGATTASGLKDAQLLSGTGATAVKRVLPPSPHKVGALVGERAQFVGGDGRLYEVLALLVPKHGVVLVQTSVPDGEAGAEGSGADALFSKIRHGVRVAAASGPAP